ncbi:sensor histidine kinase [Cohnella sp. GCM10020058]|uniref:sensor histidine kinase n=1 Tax=Cohnella sp. GCM10020058 TaxID=3317330 RepID=UPI00363F625B
MQLFTRLGNLSIFPKLILTFIAIILPMFGLSIGLNELGKREVKQQLSNTMNAQIHYYFLSLEKEIQQIIRTQMEMVNDPDLQKLVGLGSILSEYEKSVLIGNLDNKLRSYRESSVYIKDISLYVSSVSHVVTTANTALHPVTKEAMEEVYQAMFTHGFPLIYSKDRLYVNVNEPVAPGSGKTVPYMLQVELSVDALRTTLNSFNPDGETVLFNDAWSIESEQETGLFAHVKERIIPDQKNTSGQSSLRVDKKNYLVFYEKSLALDAALLFYMPENRVLGTLKTYQTWSWLLVVSSLVIVIMFSYGIYMLIHRPLRRLVKQFKSVEAGNFNVFSPHKNQDEFGYLFRQFNKMVQNLKVLIDDLYVQKIRLQHSELKQLQAQINPHFLYNSFFTLHRLILNYDNDSAAVVSKNLGEYFQYITRNAQDEVSLASEIKHARSYVEIQNVRFSNRIETEFGGLPMHLNDIRVPRLIVQPIIENVYQHGLGDKVQEGRVRIGFEEFDGTLRIGVEDNGPGLQPEELDKLRSRMNQTDLGGESTGLINVHRRLQLRFGAEYGISIARSELGGLLVNIIIPMERRDQP